MLRHLENYRLVFYRNPEEHDPLVDAAERFLISCVLDDHVYPHAEPIARTLVPAGD